MKTHYWFDKQMLAMMEDQAERGGYIAKIGATRLMKQRGHLLFNTSMMQDGWDYYPVRLQTEFDVAEFKYVCENDFERLCREYEMYDTGAMWSPGGDAILTPHIRKRD